MNDNNINQEQNNVQNNENTIVQKEVNTTRTTVTEEDVQRILNNLDSNYTMESNYYGPKKNKMKPEEKATVFLIISLCIAGLLLASWRIILLLAFAFAITSNTLGVYIILALVCGIYGGSFVSVIASIINKIAKGKIFKQCIIAVIIGFVISAIAPIAYAKSDFSAAQSQMKKNEAIKDEIVFQDDNMTLKQKEIKYTKNNIKVYFEADTTETIDTKYTHIRVNNCYIGNAKIYRDEQGLYYLEFPYNELDKYNIKNIFSIQLELNKRTINFDIDGKKEDMIKTIGLKDNQILYEDEYFKLYFVKNDDSYGDGKLYIQSLTDKDYNLLINKADFDTPGYINNYYSAELSNYLIKENTLNYSDAYNNVGYVKFDYEITYYNPNNKKTETIKSEHVDISFPAPKAPKKSEEK